MSLVTFTHNKSRRNLTEAYSNMAIKKAEEEYAGDRVLVVYIPECHESIAGIVAGRLRERFYKPSIVLTDDAEGNIKGSGRSTEEQNFSIFFRIFTTIAEDLIHLSTPLTEI